MLVCASALLLIVACNTKTETETVNPVASTAVLPASAYPYTLEKGYKEWQPGSQQNVVMVQKMLKAWEAKNVTECASYFADSVEFSMDYFHSKISKDSMDNFIKNSFADYKSVSIKMQDWESVISKDQKDEWVTLWYKQIMVHNDGKVDSLNIINDAKVVNGKIAVFDEKIQHFPAAKM